MNSNTLLYLMYTYVKLANSSERNLGWLKSHQLLEGTTSCWLSLGSTIVLLRVTVLVTRVSWVESELTRVWLGLKKINLKHLTIDIKSFADVLSLEMFVFNCFLLEICMVYLGRCVLKQIFWLVVEKFLWSNLIG